MSVAEREQNTPLVVRRFSTPEALDAAIDGYLAECKAEGQRPLIMGVCQVIGCELRTLQGYLAGEIEGITQPWLAPLKRAWLAVAKGYEDLLSSGKPVGAIFALKQMQWQDKQAVEHTGEVQIGGIRELFSAVVGKPEGTE